MTNFTFFYKKRNIISLVYSVSTVFVVPEIFKDFVFYIFEVFKKVAEHNISEVPFIKRAVEHTGPEITWRAKSILVPYVDFVFVIPELFFIVSTFSIFFFFYWRISNEQHTGSVRQECFSLSNILSGLVAFFSFLLYFNMGSVIVAAPCLLFNNLLHYNFVILFFKLLLCFFAVVYFLTLVRCFDRVYSYEYNLFVCVSVFSMFGLMSSSNYILVYLFLELQSFCFYIMVAFRRNSAFSIEAALKFFILGSLASVFILFGISLLYFSYGTFDIRYFTRFLVFPLRDDSSIFMFVTGMILFVSGLFFKLAVFPFHTWLPDVYDGAPLFVTFFLSVLSKISYIVLFVNLVKSFFIPFIYFFLPGLAGLAILSMFVGSVGALFQVRLKRFLAYSSISQIGFVVFSLTYYNNISIRVFLVYTLIYLVLNLTLFVCLSIFHSDFKILNKDFSTIYDLAYCYNHNPVLSAVLVLTLFSLAGVPPLAGFYGKFYLIYYTVALLPTVPEGITTTRLAFSVFMMLSVVLVNVISVFYYIRLVSIIFFDPKTIVLGSSHFLSQSSSHIFENFGISYFLAFILVWLVYFNVFVFFLKPSFFIL